MQYRNDKHNEPISLLGYGCMRFTKKNGQIDIDKAEKEVMAAVNAGVNYFDTAYIYTGSEVAVGEIFKRNNCREKVKIATKLPQYMINKKESIDKYFDEELKRLQTDYVDYYLMHMITDVEAWNKLVKLGIKEWIDGKKKSGAIRNIGFSFHGNSEMFIKVLEAYDWDFCQIQYNYMDETSQAGRKGLNAAYEKHIPVIIMEPLRGGKLVDMLPQKAIEAIKNNPKQYTPAEWALRWLWEQKEVTCVLSGMNTIEMVEENTRIASEVKEGEFNDTDRAMIETIKNEINAKMKVGCTGCGYCMPCPHGVDIPGTFRCYNIMYTEKKKNGRMEYMQNTALRKEPSDASKCTQCGACEKHCPQHLPIRENLKTANKELRPWHIRIAGAIGRKFMRY